jgi:hypothetical protein
LSCSSIVNNIKIERYFSTTKPTASSRPRGCWKDKQKQKEFFDQLAIKWNIQKSEDWNKVTKEATLKEGGKFIDTYYNGSVQQGIEDLIISYIYEALQAVYPDYISTAKPRGYWKDKKNQKEFFDQLAVKWNIQKPEDWHTVSTKKVIKEEGGSFIVTYYNGSPHKGKEVFLYILMWISIKSCLS